MKNDITESEAKYKYEPETHVKKTVHRTYTAKFHALIKMSGTIQSEFKNTLHSRIKTQIRVFKQDITDEELD